jgi:putative ABC transport system permease protein
MRFLRDILVQIFGSLWAHKLRTLLTMFGIAWGVGSLLLLVGLGEGFRRGNMREMAEYGQDIMFVFPGRAPVVAGNMASARSYFLTYQDYLDIRQASSVRNASPVLTRDDVKAVSEFSSANGQMVGVEPQFNQIRFLPLNEGRWLNPLDEEQVRNVVVLGDEMKKNLFPGRPSIGATILLNGVRFEVIGAIKRVGRGDNNATNIRGYLPYAVMNKYFPRTGEQQKNTISFVNYQPLTRAEHLAAEMDVRRIIARNHGFDYHDDNSFETWDTIKQSEMIGAIFDAMDVFLGGVGLVTLALGAIGVINIMLVSVSDRTREIGLRKALGATHRSVLTQFFLEGALLTLVSGLIGLGAAGGLMLLLGNVNGPQGFDPPRLVPLTALMAIGGLALAGVAAGLYPARKAALLPPVEALRKD